MGEDQSIIFLKKILETKFSYPISKSYLLPHQLDIVTEETTSPSPDRNGRVALRGDIDLTHSILPF